MAPTCISTVLVHSCYCRHSGPCCACWNASVIAGSGGQGLPESNSFAAVLLTECSEMRLYFLLPAMASTSPLGRRLAPEPDGPAEPVHTVTGPHSRHQPGSHGPPTIRQARTAPSTTRSDVAGRRRPSSLQYARLLPAAEAVAAAPIPACAPRPSSSLEQRSGLSDSEVNMCDLHVCILLKGST